MPSRLTSGGPVQFENVPQMLRGVLNVDARAGGHGPSHESPAHPTLVPLPPQCPISPSHDPAREQETEHYTKPTRKPPPGLRP